LRSVALKTPLSEQDVRDLRVGGVIHLSGEIVLARDRAHQSLLEFAKTRTSPPFRLEGSAIYHCGPLVRKVAEGWRILSAGPTTSMRMEPFEADAIGRFGVRMIIGKGGMGPSTAKAMGDFGAVYCAAPGGAGALLTKSVKEVKGVEWLDLGITEAVWLLDVEEMGPLIVAMDSHGNNLYEEISGGSENPPTQGISNQVR